MQLGTMLQECRKKRCVTQANVAESFGVNKQTVWRWEHDKRKPTVGQLCALLDFYNVHPSIRGFFLSTDKHTSGGSTYDPSCDPSVATAIFAETVDRLLVLFGAIDGTEGAAKMVADLIHNGETNNAAVRQFIQQLGEAITKSILLLRLLSLNTPEAAEALEAIANIPRAA